MNTKSDLGNETMYLYVYQISSFLVPAVTAVLEWMTMAISRTVSLEAQREFDAGKGVDSKNGRGKKIEIKKKKKWEGVSAM